MVGEMMVVAAEEAVSGQTLNFTAIIVAAIGTVGAVLSYMQASKVRRDQRRMDTRSADAEAYERARKFDQETVESIRKEAERLRALLRDEQETNRELRRELSNLDEIEVQLGDFRRALESEKRVSNKLRDQVIRLEERIRMMREHLSDYIEGRTGEHVIQNIIEEADNLLTDGPNGNG